MANIDDFGIGSSDVMGLLNPTLTLGGVHVGIAASGIDGSGGVGVYTCPGQLFTPNALQGLALFLGGSYSTAFMITGNTQTVLTLSGTPDLSLASAVYDIRSLKAILTEEQITTLVERHVGTVRSRIPHKYRRLLSEVEGEKIIRKASPNVSTAILSIASAEGESVILWENVQGNYSDRREDGSPLTGWSVDAQVVTFDAARGGTVYADYSHSLESPPKILIEIALKFICADVIDAAFHGRAGSTQPQGDLYREEANALLAGLTSGDIGIAEFDDMDLFEETEGSPSHTWGEISVMRKG